MTLCRICRWGILLLASFPLTGWAIEANPRGHAPTLENAAPAPTFAPEGMVWIPGGEFSMGMEDPRLEFCGGSDPMPDAQPIHRVRVSGFWMDRTEVTNREFGAFVRATSYVTVAERPLRPEDFPGVPAEALVPGSLVFTPPTSDRVRGPLSWWAYVPGANWRHPEGPGSSIEGREDHPVVHVAYEDAEAYAKWAGKRLPTEAEWEFAARGGVAGGLYSWGNDLQPEGRWAGNIFQGQFPSRNEAADGYRGSAPVAQFPANPYGLHDMSGNVWEWCSDWYRPDTYVNRRDVVENPTGPTRERSFDPQEPGMAKRVQRGGSFLCTDQYCTRYMVGSRGKGDVNTSSNHVGFRCVRSAR